MSTALPARALPFPPAPEGPRILLAVTGLSPQVVTETLFALARQGPEHLPTQVHILTTADGADRVRLLLLSRKPGWFHRLRRDYGLPAIAFAEANLHLLTDRRGRPLNDIRTPEENALLADQVTALVRRFTSDPASQLHISLAGGRKTMGFYAGYALSLYGRERDRLSHVLVSPPFESHPQFFYPAPRSRTIYGRDRRPLDAATAWGGPLG
jgi:CRISPR-associated protein (TIGR02584 family)